MPVAFEEGQFFFFFFFYRLVLFMEGYISIPGLNLEKEMATHSSTWGKSLWGFGISEHCSSASGKSQHNNSQQTASHIKNHVPHGTAWPVRAWRLGGPLDLGLFQRLWLSTPREGEPGDQARGHQPPQAPLPLMWAALVGSLRVRSGGVLMNS